jgi:hypothetical protein
LNVRARALRGSLAPFLAAGLSTLLFRGGVEQRARVLRRHLCRQLALGPHRGLQLRLFRRVEQHAADARELVRLLKGIPAKINLIPFNPWPGTQYECSDWGVIERFSEIVFNAGYASPVRTPRGRDILAACGQLKSETEKVRARARLMMQEDEAEEGDAAL